MVIGDLVEIPEDARKDVTYVRVPATRISTELNNPKGANIVMTGAIVKLMGDFTKEAAIAAMIHMFEEKGKSRFNGKPMKRHSTPGMTRWKHWF